MVLSMTGFGEAVGNYNGKSLRAEVRSLNGKTTDIRVKVPNVYRTKELDIRNQVLEKAFRGKVDIAISFDAEEGDDSYQLNRSLMNQYYKDLADFATENNVTKEGLIPAILKIPNVLMLQDQALSEEEWTCCKNTIDLALAQFTDFRLSEGKAMAKDIEYQVSKVVSLLEDVVPFETERIVNLKDRLSKNIGNYVDDVNLDKNRMEQEILYYVEKLDITEEKIRLAQHCKYFLEVLHGEQKVKGKKLSFISQEMGREMNTLGSKAQHSDIQQIVVNMKDALEKIKEQILNIV